VTYRGGNFYVSAYRELEPGRFRVVAEHQCFTFEQAKDWLDSRDSAGNIEEWVERKGQRQSRARRTVEGQWLVRSMHGEKPLEEAATPAL
jgi:hypothetical protein